jgi:hypothetical protein
MMEGELPYIQHHPTLMHTKIRDYCSKIYWNLSDIAY